MDQKEKRNAQIIQLHNHGLSTQKIADKVGISKAAVYKVVTAYLDTVKGSTKPTPTPEADNVQTVAALPDKAKQSAPASTVTGTGKRILSFGELQYTGTTNEYVNKQTGELIKVKFIPAKAPNEYGYFVTV